MNTEIDSLLHEISSSRSTVENLVKGLSTEQGRVRIEPNGWNIQEVIEHLVLAERGGYDLIHTAAERFKSGNPIWKGDSENVGLSIEEIIERTWKKKETAPASALPSGKWSLGVWISHFKNCDDLLSNLHMLLEDLPLDQVIYPHFLCGPLNAYQRLEFIRFHIDRHYSQIGEIKKKLLQ